MARDRHQYRAVVGGLLAADAVIHVAGYVQARNSADADQDRTAMAVGAAAYTALAIGVLAGNKVARRIAKILPAFGIVAVLANWQRSTLPTPTRSTIIAIDAALVAAA